MPSGQRYLLLVAISSLCRDEYIRYRTLAAFIYCEYARIVAYILRPD